MNVRAKFKVAEVTTFERGEQKRVKLYAQWDDGIPENTRFAKATPCGEIIMQIDNPSAAEVFKAGQVFYVDFIPVE